MPGYCTGGWGLLKLIDAFHLSLSQNSPSTEGKHHLTSSLNALRINILAFPFLIPIKRDMQTLYALPIDQIVVYRVVTN